MDTWTKPYHGVQHLGHPKDNRWASIEDYGSFTTLTKWYKGCGFSAAQEDFDTVEQARSAGAQWIAGTRQ